MDAGQICEALRPRFGSAVVDSPGFGEELLPLLLFWAPYKCSFADLASALEDRIFKALYDRLGPGMAVRTEQGSFRRVPLSELSDAADDVLGVLFEALKPYSVNYDALHSYWVATGSYQAMRVLLLRYSSFLPDREEEYLRKLVRESGASPR